MKNDNDHALKAAELLAEARFLKPLNELPEFCRPKNIQEVYAIHDSIITILGPVLGWKVGAANNEAEPICAPILSGTLFKSPVIFEPEMFNMRGIESEIAFRFTTALPPKKTPYIESSVLNAVDAAFPAIEICETRFLDTNAVDDMSNLADNISNGALILGPEWFEWKKLQIDEQPVELIFDNKIVVSHKGGNKAGNIIRLLVWITNHLSSRGIGISKDQIITTGSWTGMIKSGSAKNITTIFSGIGEVEISFNN
jgi:2-keto-4-pentenoate hydratase